MLFISLQSCSVEEVNSKEANYQASLLEQTKKFVPEQMKQNPNNFFLKSFPLTLDWANTTTDSSGNLKIPVTPPENAIDKFELIVSIIDGQLVGKIEQSRRSLKSSTTYSKPVIYDLNGYLISKPVTKKPATNAREIKVLGTNKYLDTDFLPMGCFAMKCPDGLLFDQDKEMCVWPDAAPMNATSDYIIDSPCTGLQNEIAILDDGFGWGPYILTEPETCGMGENTVDALTNKIRSSLFEAENNEMTLETELEENNNPIKYKGKLKYIVLKDGEGFTVRSVAYIGIEKSTLGECNLIITSFSHPEHWYCEGWSGNEPTFSTVSGITTHWMGNSGVNWEYDLLIAWKTEQVGYQYFVWDPARSIHRGASTCLFKYDIPR